MTDIQITMTKIGKFMVLWLLQTDQILTNFFQEGVCKERIRSGKNLGLDL